MTQKIILLLSILSLFGLSACKSKTSVPPPIAPPSSSPSSLPGGLPTAGLPSPSAPFPSAPSASIPSPGQPTAGLPSPAMPSPSLPSISKSGDPTAENGEQRARAGGDLKKSGDELAKAGAESGGESQPDDHDSLMPEADQSDNRMGDDLEVAVQEAAEAMQSAGDAMANAASDAEIIAATEALSNARIAIISAEAELEASQETQTSNEASDLNDLAIALEAANAALVIASQTMINSGGIEPNLPDGLPEEGILESGNAELATLEGQLDTSLEIFDGKMTAAREGVLSGTNGSSAPEIVMAELPELEDPRFGPSVVDDQGTESKSVIAISDLPADLPNPQGDDIVAKQLREAAVAETDPKLKDKLWQEYKRYRAGL